MQRLILILLLVGTGSAFGASQGSGGGSSSGGGGFKFGKDSSAWLAVGGGTLTAGEPLHSQIGYTGQVSVMTGGDLSLFGPIFFTVSAVGKWSSGKMSYDYTDANNAHYTAQNVSVTQSVEGFDLGLQIRLINGNSGHVFVEGGGFVQTWNMSYDFTQATSISLGGFDPQKSQSNVAVAGTYAKIGLDVILVKGFGLRVFGRAGQGTTSKIAALGNQSLKFVEGEGYAGFIKQF